MEPTNAQSITKKISKEVHSLEPSALITLYEIDLSKLLVRNERVVNTDRADLSTELRFHNNLKSINTSIWFGGKEYFPAPIKADGFETSAKGSPPTPRLSITANPEGLDSDVLERIKYIRYAVRDLDNLSGAEVRRIRTFVKYIDGRNFYKNYGTNTQELWSPANPAPKDFEPTPSATFPEDLYIIDRKSGENKNTLEFELASPFDVHDLKLPGRIVTEVNCVWTYRGEGCCYEYNTVKNADLNSRLDSQNGKYKHDSLYYNENSECKATSSGNAPPVANYKNENILDLLSVSSLNESSVSSRKYIPGALWNEETEYIPGDFCRTQLNGVNYYFVAKSNSMGAPPPNSLYWIADECSKTMNGCKKRWSDPLPIGAFPTSRRGGTS